MLSCASCLVKENMSALCIGHKIRLNIVSLQVVVVFALTFSGFAKDLSRNGQAGARSSNRFLNKVEATDSNGKKQREKEPTSK